MNKETEISLLQRILEHIDNKTTDMLAENTRVLAEDYCSEIRYLLEQQLLKTQPVIVGHVSQLKEVGDFFTFEELGVPLIVSKTKTGEIKAFFNVCRHRGTRISEDNSGCKKRSFVCPYHGWTYGLDGALINIPHAYGFPNLEQETLGLVSVPVEVHLGLIWAILTPGTELDVPEFLGSLNDELRNFQFESHFLYQPFTMKKPLNWKLAIDIFLEGYHVQRAHAKTIAKLFLDNIGLYDRFSPHLRNLFPKRSVVELKNLPHEQWELRQHANILYYIFPNTLILVQPDHANCLTVYPQGIDSCIIYAQNLVSTNPDTEKSQAYWDKNLAILYGATEEDFAMGESIQQGLKSGANQYIQLGGYEMALHYFHQGLNSYLAMQVK